LFDKQSTTWRHFPGAPRRVFFSGRAFLGRAASSLFSGRTVQTGKIVPQQTEMDSFLGEIPLAATVDDGNGSGLLPLDDLVAKKRHSSPRLALTNKQTRKTIHPFIIKPDESELVMYRCLAVSKPFTTAKGKGVTDAWTDAVKEINKQKNFETGKAVFDPPIPAKTVRERFESAMKIVKELHAEVAFRSGEDDEAEPNEMLMILEDLYEQKTSFETGQSERKGNAADKKKKDREAAKIVQRAAIGEWCARKASLSSSDSPATDSDPDVDKITGSRKKSKASPAEAVVDLAQTFSEKKAEKKADREIKRRQLELQMDKDRQQMEMNAAMLDMMKSMSANMKKN
jgi:hypothetical protein